MTLLELLEKFVDLPPDQLAPLLKMSPETRVIVKGYEAEYPDRVTLKIELEVEKRLVE